MSPKRLKLIRKTAELVKPWGVHLSDTSVCEGHTCTAEIFTAMFIGRLSEMLIQGPRGGGKSYMAAMATHLTSLVYPGHGTRILGGSMSQSEQIYNALEAFDQKRPDRSPFTSFTKTKATYFNGSDVSILAASPTSVRGPHVPTLMLDEVDEIERDIREQANQIAMAKNGVSSSIIMMSTWHRIAGPMADLIKKAEDGAFKYYKFCIFETLERCPEERSGPALENCPECELMKYCHSDKHLREDGLPKAKRSKGHYKISDLIQKIKLTAIRIFESDMLSLRPRSSGVWFTEFNRADHVSDSAEYDRNRNFHVSIDPGVHTAAVWFQHRASLDGSFVEVNVFGDYYAEEKSAEENAREIMKKTYALTGVGVQYANVSIDPAANSRTGIGPTMRGEYERAGCKGRNGKLLSWPAGPHHSKQDGLAFIEALLKTADQRVHLKIHLRCKWLTDSFEGYVRAVRDNQAMDYPADPQHFAEDLMDALRGGLKTEYPKGRSPQPQFQKVHAANLH